MDSIAAIHLSLSSGVMNTSSMGATLPSLVRISSSAANSFLCASHVSAKIWLLASRQASARHLWKSSSLASIAANTLCRSSISKSAIAPSTSRRLRAASANLAACSSANLCLTAAIRDSRSSSRASSTLALAISRGSSPSANILPPSVCPSGIRIPCASIFSLILLLFSASIASRL